MDLAVFFTYLGWGFLGAVVLLVLIYIGARIINVAHFRTRLEYDRSVTRVKEEESNGKK